jgi:hypothetical protein
MNEWDRLRRAAAMNKERYPPGTRIELIHMGEDPNPIPDGTRGTVTAVDDIGTVFCDFDNGRSLGLAYGEDSFRRLTPEEIAEEQTETNNESMAEDEGPAIKM